MKGGINMCESFYHWETDDVTGFRKLMLHDFETVFVKERDKFSDWDGECKYCKYCNRNLPKSTYFFKVANKNNFDSKCKECWGNRYSWGVAQQKIFETQGMYYCRKCDVVYPLNDIYFVRNKNTQSGFAKNCKQCSFYSPNFGINRNLNLIVDVLNNYQICLDCHVELPQTQDYFFKMKFGEDRLETTCKKCQGIEYGIHKVNQVFKNEEYRYCHGCCDFLEIDQFYIKDAKSNLKISYCKKCNYIKNQNRRHDKENSDYGIEDWSFALNFWTDNGNIRCAYCNTITDKPQMEHIIPYSKGGEFARNNIIPVCKTCNCSKNNRSLEEFYIYSDNFKEEMLIKVKEYIKITS